MSTLTPEQLAALPPRAQGIARVHKLHDPTCEGCYLLSSLADALLALAEARRDSERLDKCECIAPYFSIHGNSDWISILGAVPKGGAASRPLREAIDEFFCEDAARSAGEEKVREEQNAKALEMAAKGVLVGKLKK